MEDNMEYQSRYKLVAEPSDYPKVRVTDSKQVYEVVRQYYFEDINVYESMFLLLLNSQCETIGYVKVSQGGTMGTVIDTKLIVKYAIDSLSAAVILCHNHPSGNLKPSNADIKNTKIVKDILNLMGINLFDHLIITETSFTSMGDEGLL